MYANLKLQLWKTGIKQNRLAKLLDMDETTLSRVVNGFREPSDELRESIARLLSCDVKWLFEEEVTDQPPSTFQSAPSNSK
jgi:transcriptional regulator with XRE-family HTH domain